MTTDVRAAESFVIAHARVLDRRRLHLLLHGADAEGVLGALAAYRNPDGGYGCGLEPDLRSAESQPAAAMHAFEVLAETLAGGMEQAADDAVRLCGWLAARTRPDGGLPFARPIADPTGCAPFWAGADPHVSSLMMTAQVAANALRVAAGAPAVAAHPWLAAATTYCLRAIGELREAPPAYELMFALRFLDVLTGSTTGSTTGRTTGRTTGSSAQAAALLAELGAFVPADGRMPVAGGAEGESLHPLDLAPHPDRLLRALLAPAVIEADLDRLAGQQQPDGGWIVDYDSYSPAAALDWRGYATVRAIEVLRANGRC